MYQRSSKNRVVSLLASKYRLMPDGAISSKGFEPLIRFENEAMVRKKVFITDGFWRKTLSAVRTLGRNGIEVTVGEHCRPAPAFFSKYCSKKVIYPSPHSAPDRFILFLMDELRKTHYHCLLPMEEETLLLISRHKEEIRKLTYLLSPDHDKILFARDKGTSIRHAVNIGIPCPKTFFVDDLQQVEKIASTASFPLVIKPRISSGSRGICYVSEPDGLTAIYHKIHQNYPYPLIQERIPGGSGAFCLSALFSEASELKASFVHKRLREYPLSGGPSTLRESVYHEEVKSLGLKLLRSLDWVGVASVEFKVDPRTGRPMLMEINPRFWGSLSLAIYAGMDFPNIICKMAAGEDVPPQHEYRIGKKTRWLLPGDMMHFYSSLRLGKIPKDFFSFRDKDTAYDIISRDDPLPVLGTVLSLTSLFFNKDMRRFLADR